eukprot:4109573-Prymnesium_polylepis.1
MARRARSPCACAGGGAPVDQGRRSLEKHRPPHWRLEWRVASAVWGPRENRIVGRAPGPAPQTETCVTDTHTAHTPAPPHASMSVSVTRRHHLLIVASHLALRTLLRPARSHL